MQVCWARHAIVKFTSHIRGMALFQDSTYSVCVHQLMNHSLCKKNGSNSPLDCLVVKSTDGKTHGDSRFV